MDESKTVSGGGGIDMDESKTVSATTARPRGVWVAAVGVLIVGLLLLNVDSIGRVAIDAYERMQARQAERERDRDRDRDRAAMASAPAVAASVEPPPPVEAVRPVPGPRAVASVAPRPAAAVPAAPAAQPLERLYPTPAPAAATAPAPSGRAGLVMLIRSGALRPASGADLANWKMRYASNNPGGVGQRFDQWARTMPAYVIVGDMAIPDGLSGADSVIFLLGDKAPFPTGEQGHSVILDPVSGSCIGRVCGMLLER